MSPTVLSRLSFAFSELADTVKQNRDMEVKAFAQACSYITSLVRHLGPYFIFAVTDFSDKVDDIKAASFRTLRSMIEADIEQNNVLTEGSHSFNLLMVKRVIQMVTILFQKIVATNFNDEGDNLLVTQGLEAYSMIFGQHHGEGLKATLERYKSKIPNKAELLVLLKEENGASCTCEMKTIAEAATLITQYIDNLYISRGIAIDG